MSVIPVTWMTAFHSSWVKSGNSSSTQLGTGQPPALSTTFAKAKPERLQYGLPLLLAQSRATLLHLGRKSTRVCVQEHVRQLYVIVREPEAETSSPGVVLSANGDQFDARSLSQRLPSQFAQRGGDCRAEARLVYVTSFAYTQQGIAQASVRR